MQEAFLHYIWQFQHFTTRLLFTTQQEPIQVLQIGQANTHAGADFQQARLMIGALEWIGSVEIHIKSSDWKAHAHQQDEAYENVILHVVWLHDQDVHRSDGTLIPTLVLAPIVAPTLWKTYESLYQSTHPMPCQAHFASIDGIYKRQMLDQALMQRLERKAQQVLALWEAQEHDWETVAYRLLARNFGFHLNAEPFERLARHLPLKIIRKHGNNILQIEALLFGMAGFLDSPPLDDYQTHLQQEYHFLTTKYQLPSQVIALHEWKFLRLRPANFPTVRIAQLASLLQQQTQLFAWLVYPDALVGHYTKLKIQPSAYWQEHYMFGRKQQRKAMLGSSALSNVLINTAVPLMVAYSTHRQEAWLLQQALEVLESLPAEENVVLRRWEMLGMTITSAFDSQGILQWEQAYCQPKKCLSCSVGIQLMGKTQR